MANTNGPVKKFQAGGVQAAVWKNETQLKDGTTMDRLSASFERRYKGKDGSWHSSSSLQANDIPKTILVLTKAYEYMTVKDPEASKVAEEVVL